MIHRIFALAFAGLLVLAAPAASKVAVNDSAGNEPRARAWAVRVSVTDAAANFVQIGDVAADAGSQPTADAAAYLVGGQGSGAIRATLSNPDVVDKKINYEDPTGSMTIEGGFAEAHVNSQGANARAGIGNSTGNGFAIASQYFTFDQQTETLNQWVALQDAIFTPLNSVVDQLNPLLGTAGKPLPHFVPAPAAGLIDVMTGRGLAGTSSTTASPGYNQAIADASLGDLKLLGGFLELHDVAAAAESSSSNGQDQRSARSNIGGIYIAGIEVVQDSEGFRVASNDIVSRTVVQPALDLAMSALESAGLTITFAEKKASGDLREATALELRWVTDAGIMLISVGHAEASSASVGAAFEEPPGGGFIAPPPSGGEPPTAVSPVGPTAQEPPGTAPSVAPPTSGGPTVRSLGPAAARAIRTAYLIFLVAGFVASLGYPMFMRRHWSRRFA